MGLWGGRPRWHLPSLVGKGLTSVVQVLQIGACTKQRTSNLLEGETPQQLFKSLAAIGNTVLGSDGLPKGPENLVVQRLSFDLAVSVFSTNFGLGGEGRGGEGREGVGKVREVWSMVTYTNMCTPSCEQT